MSGAADVRFDAAAWAALERARAGRSYGYLLGRGALAAREVVDVVPGAELPLGDALVLPPAEWLRTEKAARARGLDVLGVYQVGTTPDAARHAAVPEATVLCLVRGPGEVACFERDEGAFVPLVHATEG